MPVFLRSLFHMVKYSSTWVFSGRNKIVTGALEKSLGDIKILPNRRNLTWLFIKEKETQCYTRYFHVLLITALSSERFNDLAKIILLIEGSVVL